MHRDRSFEAEGKAKCKGPEAEVRLACTEEASVAEVERKKGGVRHESEWSGKPESEGPHGLPQALGLRSGCGEQLSRMLLRHNRTAAQLTSAQTPACSLRILTHLTAVVLKEAEERVEIYG